MTQIVKVLYILFKYTLRVLIAGVLIPSSLSIAAEQIVIGKAYNLSGELEYFEHHRVRYQNGQIIGIKTIFFDDTLQKVGELVSDFSNGQQFGSYDLIDSRHQYVDGARITADRIELYHRKSPKRDLKTKSLPLTPKQVVGQGFNQFIVANLDAIAGGEEFHMKLVLPSELDQYDVLIRKRKIDGHTLYIRVEMSNWFLKLFAPHLDAEYDLKTGRLMRYDGISMIAAANGKNSRVSITYEYEPDRTLLAKLSRF